MQPNAPPAPPPAPMPDNPNPYGFIMDTEHRPKRSIGGGSMKTRLLIVVIGLGILLIGVVVFMNIIGGSGNSDVDKIVKLAQQQNEIARVAGLAKDKATSSSTKNLAITTQLSLESDQAATLALLKKSGHKVSPQQLNLLKNSNTDQQLDAASTTGTFDSTFTDLLNKDLATYSQSLQSTYKGAAKKSEKDLLQSSFNDVSYLLGTQKSS